MNYNPNNEQLRIDPDADNTAFVPEDHLFQRHTPFSLYNTGQQYVGSLDVIGMGLAVLMTLGPLAAYATGFGA